MGVKRREAEFLLSAVARGMRIQRVLMLGEQTLYVERAELDELLRRYHLRPPQFDAVRLTRPGAPDPLGIGPGRQFLGELLRALGACEVESLDASDYDAATVIHDLNEPVPPSLRDRFDLVYDGGTLEHIFNFPVALANCMRMVRPGGTLVLATPANNFCGHGFYQFSPALFYDVLSEANGFQIEREAVVEDDGRGRWYEVRDPASAGGRVELDHLTPHHPVRAGAQDGVRPALRPRAATRRLRLALAADRGGLGRGGRSGEARLVRRLAVPAAPRRASPRAPRAAAGRRAAPADSATAREEGPAPPPVSSERQPVPPDRLVAAGAQPAASSPRTAIASRASAEARNLQAQPKGGAVQGQIKLGRVFGVPLGLHYTWLIIAVLVTMSLAAQFGATHPLWSPGLTWGAAIVTGLLFFVTLILHELSHALVARGNGVPVRSITLFALGGVAQIEGEARSATVEFWMGLVGPLTSFAIGGLCLGVAWLLPHGAAESPFVAVVTWLGYINIVLAVFNLIPGFPLDGGRVLRAILWWLNGNPDRATRIAARVGQIVAFLFIAVGLLRLFAGSGFGGLWLAFIGWFLLEAARASYAEVEVMASLRGVRVADVMVTDCGTVDAHSTLQQFVDDHLLRTGRRCFVVRAEDGHVEGLITPNEVREVDRAEWSERSVSDAMRPIDRLRTIEPDAPATEALTMMAREDVNQLPVVSRGRLEGMVSRGQILRLLRARSELGT